MHEHQTRTGAILASHAANLEANYFLQLQVIYKPDGPKCYISSQQINHLNSLANHYAQSNWFPESVYPDIKEAIYTAPAAPAVPAAPAATREKSAASSRKRKRSKQVSNQEGSAGPSTRR